MKTKPILIANRILAVVIIGFFFVSCNTAQSSEKAEIAAFLKDVSYEVKAGNVAAVRSYFDNGYHSKSITTLASVLCNKTNIGGAKPLFAVNLNTEGVVIKTINAQFSTAIVKVDFSYAGLPVAASSLSFNIHKIAANQFKIASVDARAFVKNYTVYQTRVVNKTRPAEDIFDPITMSAFNTAKQLKGRYDSVLWFAHVHNRTYYYVCKDTITEGAAMYDAPPTHSMGLLNPDLKEIIPPQYDLIHNISGTIDGMIEVEKGLKRGLYSLDGKLVIAAAYDAIYPLQNSENLALLKNVSGYFYLKKDLTITSKLQDFKISSVLAQIRAYGTSLEMPGKTTGFVMEHNDRDLTTSPFIPPSYLVDWKILSRVIEFQNPLRKNDDGMGDGSVSISAEYSGSQKESDSWFESAFYSVADDYLGSRAGLYTTKNVVIIDKKQNNIVGFRYPSYFGGAEGGGHLSGACAENRLKMVNDSLIEFRTTCEFDQPLLNGSMIEGPYFHYLAINNGALRALDSERLFPTQFVKLDDPYLQGCYVMGQGGSDEYHPDKKITVDHLTSELLQYMKNEIYASYQYRFKSARWTEIFRGRFERYNGGDKSNVESSLTAIDKYNINWINNKLKITKPAIASVK